jgi:hypothetical protein
MEGRELDPDGAIAGAAECLEWQDVLDCAGFCREA